MATEREAITRGHELYVKHVSLFGRAVPTTIKAAIRKLVQNKGHTLSEILTDKKDHIRIFYNDLYQDLFEDDDDENIDERLESFGITPLCDLVLLLTEQPNVDYIKCILDQRRDLEKYAKDHFLDYPTYDIKYTALQKSLLELFENTDVKFEVTRLIHSFDESKDTRISDSLIHQIVNSLKLTDDVDRHIEIVKKCVLSSIAKEEIEDTRETVIELTKNEVEEVQTIQFVQQLSDTILRAGESSVVLCELNKEDCHVVWSKNGEIIMETRTVHILADKGRHYLVFSKAVPEDSGTYKCSYKHLSTSASLIIAKKPDVLIETPLHNEQDGDIREYMRVVLSCTINLTGKTPRWFRNNKEIEASNAKLTIVSTDCEHKLVIEYVTSDDCGEYMVAFDGATSKMTITTKGNINLRIKHEIKQKHYKNWIKGVLGLKYVKLGLQTPVKKAIESHHTQILKDLPDSLSHEKCSDCNAVNLLPAHLEKQCPRTQNRKKCPCYKSSYPRRECPSKGLCGEIYDMIVRDHRYEKPAMRNAKMKLWKTDALSVAACYISNTDYIHPFEYQCKKSVEEIDCAEILSLFVNNKTYLQNTNFGVFDMAKRHRNELIHNPNYEISEDKLHEYLNDFQKVLEVKNYSQQMVFYRYPEIKESLRALKELKDYDIDIHTYADLEKMKKEIKDAAMNEAAVKLGDAMEQKNEEIRRLERELACIPHDTMEEMCEKHDGTRNSWYCADHGRLICKSCMDKEHKTCSGLMKLKDSYTEDKQISIVYKESHLQGPILSMCSLPRGEFLAQVLENTSFPFKLYKLDKDYRRSGEEYISPYNIRGICYIGNSRIVSIDRMTLALFDVVSLKCLHSESIKDIRNDIYDVACHGDIIYLYDGRVVLTLTTDRKYSSILCKLPGQNADQSGLSSFWKIAVSNDGESIYCLHGDQYHEISKINSRNGEIIYTYDLSLLHVTQCKSIRKEMSISSYIKKKFKQVPTDEIKLGKILCMCCIGGGQVIICDDKGHVVKVNDRDEYVVSVIPAIKAKSPFAFSMCYDTTTSSLLVGHGKGIDIYNVVWS